MTVRQTLSRLDWALFFLRWVLVGAVVIFALALPGLHSPEDLPVMQAVRDRLLAAAVLGGLIALGGLGLVLWKNESMTPGVIALVIDSLYAGVLFWASNGEPLLLIGAGLLPVVNGALRIGGGYGLGVALLEALAAPVLYVLVIEPTGSPLDVLPASGVLALLGVAVGLPLAASRQGWDGLRLMLEEREAESARLREAREHARAVYEMAATLSSTLNYQAVLDAALDVGVLGLRQMGPNARLVSAVLLYDEASGRLKIANARRLTNADLRMQVPGRRGVLGLALRQAEPVFANDAQRDPELRYFVAFQDSRSILCVPLRAGYDSFGVLVFGSTLPNAFGEEHVDLLTAIATQATIALQNATLYQNLLEEKERIIDVEEDARRQLSRDLHDGPTQQVAAIAMRVNYIRRLLERDPAEVPAELQKVEELARQTSKEIRHMLFTLRPLVLETQGLIPALHEMAKKLHETHNQNVIIQVQDGVNKYIDTNDESVLFNIADEAVNNARKHAQAAHIWVRLSRRDDYLLLEVEDDGVGFNTGEVDANYDQRGSLGMINLRERAELLNGTLRIESAEGKGTKVSVVAPLRESILREIKTDTHPGKPVLTADSGARAGAEARKSEIKKPEGAKPRSRSDAK